MTGPLEQGAAAGEERAAPSYGFALVRRGYDRAAVDAFAHAAHAEISELRHRYEALAAHYQQQQEQLAAQQDPGEADFSGVGGRAQEILRIAEEQARDLTARSSTDADRMLEQAQHEVQLLQDHAAAELEDRRTNELARITALRDQTEQQAAALLASASAEAEQLVGAARQHADALQTEAEHNARAGLEAARLQAAAVAAEAEQAALAVRQQAADQRDEVLRTLQAEAEDLRARVAETLADATRMHRESAEHLSAETERAAQLRTAAAAEAEQIRSAALREADDLVSRARVQAATVDERSRQEFAWRRRQLRQEQDLLTRRKQAMLGQLASLSALAVETAEAMPDVPELRLDDEQEGPRPEGGPSADGDGTETVTSERLAVADGPDHHDDPDNHDDPDSHDDQDSAAGAVDEPVRHAP